MKKLSATLRHSLKPHKEEADEAEADSILVSPVNNSIDTTNLSKSLANFLTRPIDTFGSRGSLHRRKDKNASLFAGVRKYIVKRTSLQEVPCNMHCSYCLFFITSFSLSVLLTFYR
jgi:hypothetical protein